MAVEPAEGLVEQQQVGALGDGAREVRALLQAERELARMAVGDVGEADARQQVGGLAARGRAGRAPGAQEVLGQRQLVEQLGVLEGARDAEAAGARSPGA